MLRKLHELGVKSDYMYIAGIASVGLAVGSWFLSYKRGEELSRRIGSGRGRAYRRGMSLRRRGSSLDRADRWGIFVGEWAPTFVALGNGLRSYEHEDKEEENLRHLSAA
ncbi:hypothetical protein SAMN04489717_2464 [Actinopolymorpha singaporensis]|uniref:Uncharacterized protein n=1 Tax=Actinopolymorpha singaporensis TaxID=117157 RepID=A0A1H1RLE4_9ACTN|nr:hypothetical protein SAMN04489717_2464 [Actinopolymorpha singaporensis]